MNWLTHNNLLLQALKMKRLDFLHGVLFLTFSLLTPIFLQIYGYLDVQTYDTITHDNTFCRESIEPIRAFSHYRNFLLVIYFLLVVILVGFAFEPTVRRVSRFQIKCFRPYYLRSLPHSLWLKVCKYDH